MAAHRSRTRTSGQRTRCPRHGIALVAVLICLTVVLSLMAAWLRTIVLERSAAREQQARVQAVWLAESALDRAAARLTANPAYTGETWQVPADELGGHDDGEVVIRVAAVAGQPARRTIHVQADYPVVASRRHRSTKSIEIIAIPREK